MEEMWVCKQCGHFVLYDGCGYVFGDHQVQTCERCPSETPVEAPAILNEAELTKEQSHHE